MFFDLIMQCGIMFPVGASSARIQSILNNLWLSVFDYLYELPISEVKMDKQFVQKIQKDKKQKAILEGVYKIANKLGIRMIVEGVETEGQLLSLARFQNIWVQGHLHSMPIRVEDFHALVENNTLSENTYFSKLGNTA